MKHSAAELERVIDGVFELYESGALSAERALAVLKFDTGRAERSEGSVEIGQILNMLQRGTLSPEDRLVELDRLKRLL